MDINGTNASTLAPAPSPADGVPPGVKIAKTTVCMLVLAVSLIENVFTLITLKRNATGRMRTPNSFFIANMTVADILFAVQNLALTYNNIMLNSNFLVQGNLGTVLCKLDMFLSAVLLIIANLTILAIAIDRFFAVFVPFKKLITHRVCYVLILLAWLISSAIAAPLLYYSNLLKYGPSTICHSADQQAFKKWFTVMAGVLATTLVLMLILYTAIGIKLKKVQLPGNVSERAHQQREKRNRDIYKMLITLIVVYYACTVPYFLVILSSLHGFFEHMNGIEHVRFIASFMLFLHSAINPVVYVIFNENFRSGAIEVVRRCICCRRFSFAVNYQERTGTRVSRGYTASHFKQSNRL